MICPVCNQNIPDGSNYCPSCAADLTKYRRQIVAGRQQAPRYPQQDPRAMPQQSPMAPQQDPRMQQQPYAGQYPPFPPQYGEGGGEGGLLEGITPRGKLFFGIGGLVLVGVLALLVVNLFGGGGGGTQATQPPAPTEAPTFEPFGHSLFNTPEPDEGEDEDFGNLFMQPTPPPATPMPVFTVLKRGSSGPEVARLQERLQLLGYLPADALIDGVYGTATVNAVKEFQRKTDGLTADGDAGPLTQTRLFSIPIITGEPEPGTPPDEVIPNQPG